MCYNDGSLVIGVTNGGSGYATVPTVSFTGGSGGNISAIAQIDGSGAVTNLVLSNNWGYVTLPTTVVFTGGGGSGAGASIAMNGNGATGAGLGALATLNDSNINTGTWTLSVSGGNSFTMTSPSGATTNVVLPPSWTSLFTAPLSAYFGAQVGDAASVGNLSVLSEVKITGTANPIDDVFVNDSVLNTNYWVKNAVDATGVIVVPSGQQWVYWTVPAVGYTLQSGSSLATFADVTSQPVQFGSVYGALAPVAPGNQFFRAIKRTPTQLQVLFPGQVNAPGTTLGYTGTPTPISIAAQGTTTTTITVNLCDATWHIVNATDNITITGSSDTAAYMPANPAAMVNGTATFTGDNGILFQTTGPQTVTAHDNSDPTISDGTNAPVTVTN
jgi:hypothetical protein